MDYTTSKPTVSYKPNNKRSECQTSEDPAFAAHRTRFSRLCKEILAEPLLPGNAGIGTLAEKRMHAILKRYICEDTDLHEVGVLNTRYISDVRIGNNVYEIQTGAFYPMRKKIAYYLEQTNCSVTIVHPILVNKYVCWVDPVTQDISARKKSPKHEQANAVLPELYGLLPYLNHPNLHIHLLFLEVQDFRLLNGWSHDRKKGSARYERIPLALLEERTLDSSEDYRQFLPNALPQRFTVKEFSALTKLHGRDAYSAVRVLETIGLFSPAQPVGRAMAFTINPSEEH